MCDSTELLFTAASVENLDALEGHTVADQTVGTDRVVGMGAAVDGNLQTVLVLLCKDQ